ncbi:unnamed protein product [Toxocara canis]|uniref:Uncharacterized protein n=1 Tax=Toxocara canis TaxID=6265 RepID=A0A183UW62_TOXCA|nr:unnamed protein product [Toxocara canis]
MKEIEALERAGNCQSSPGRRPFREALTRFCSLRFRWHITASTLNSVRCVELRHLLDFSSGAHFLLGTNA